MYSATTLIALLLAGSGLVSGHGIISKVETGGKSYPGSLGPGSDASKSPVRKVSSGDPIDDVTLPSMACGTDAKVAPVSVTAKAGDNVDVFWMAETGIDWFHLVGPVLSYMTKCPGDCKDFTPSASTEWFKVDEKGLKSDGTTWFQADMSKGSPTSFTIPSVLSNGNYLLRHEIIALQNGQTKDKAEFYPNCVQMTISGGASGDVSPSPTTHFPGAYKDTDPGILVNVYNPGFKYVMPGPAVASIAKGSSGGDSAPAPAPHSSAPANAAPSPSDAAPTTSAPAAAPTSTSSGSKQCKRSRKAKRSQKRALRAHAKRRMADASY